MRQAFTRAEPLSALKQAAAPARRVSSIEGPFCSSPHGCAPLSCLAKVAHLYGGRGAPALLSFPAAGVARVRQSTAGASLYCRACSAPPLCCQNAAGAQVAPSFICHRKQFPLVSDTQYTPAPGPPCSLPSLFSSSPSGGVHPGPGQGAGARDGQAPEGGGAGGGRRLLGRPSGQFYFWGGFLGRLSGARLLGERGPGADAWGRPAHAGPGGSCECGQACQPDGCA